MKELAAGCRKACAGLVMVLGLGILLTHTGDAAEFTATTRISLADGGDSVGNEVVSATAPAISHHTRSCVNAPPEVTQPYYAGSADTVTGNGTGSMGTVTYTCRGPLPLNAERFQTMVWL